MKRSSVEKKGTPSATNYPGSRRYFSMALDTKQDLLYIFGGVGLSFSIYLNDIWMFNFTSNEVTLLSGGSISETSSSSNDPSERLGQTMALHPTMDALLIFGGEGSDYFNDLWMYEHKTSQWTCLFGNSTSGAQSFFGAQGIPSAANAPGGRSAHTMVVHYTSNVLYVFGGSGYYDSTREGTDLVAYFHKNSRFSKDI